MIVLLCVAIVILICFLFGGIASAAARRPQKDSLRLPLTALFGMMLMSLMGLVWASHLPRHVDQPTQCMITETEALPAPAMPTVAEPVTPTQIMTSTTEIQSGQTVITINGSTIQMPVTRMQIETDSSGVMTITQTPAPSADTPTQIQIEKSDDTDPTPAQSPCPCDH